MTTRLILARHGNTFNPEDTPVWVGARTDLPLVAKGLIQAHQLADNLKQAGIELAALISGPLQRTKQTASIVIETLGLEPSFLHIDRRLTEIDYGIWEAQSTEEIKDMGGEAELAAWAKQAVFPTTPGWTPDENTLVKDTAAIVSEAASGTSLIVTSNGILRFFARAAANAANFPDLKVATGHLCVLEMDKNGKWQIIHWNKPPSILSL